VAKHPTARKTGELLRASTERAAEPPAANAARRGPGGAWPARYQSGAPSTTSVEPLMSQVFPATSAKLPLVTFTLS